MHMLRRTLAPAMMLTICVVAPAYAQSVAYIDQVGDYNRAVIEQTGSVASEAGIVQRGAGNRHEIVQRSGVNQYARIVAVGDGNGSAQPGSVGGLVDQRGDDQTALVRSQGFGNGFRVLQSGESGANLAAVVQQGDGNNAGVTQTNTGAAAISASSAGTVEGLVQSGNMAGLMTKFAGAITGDANASLQVQAGFNNTAEVVQSGQGNVAVQGQIGSGNVMRLTQIGNDNSFAHTQLGANNVLDHTQIGSGIVGATVTQTGGSVAAITEVR